MFSLLFPPLLTLATPAWTDSPWLYGVHWLGPEANLSDVSAMAGGKPVWSLETLITQDTGMWGAQGQRARLQAAVNEGHTLILRVQPVWGKAFPLPEDLHPSMAGFLSQVRSAATLLKDVCHIWHLGNEMNLDFEWGGRELAPEVYIDAAAQFADVIHSVTSSLGPQKVLVGPLSPGPEESVRWMGSTEYLTRMCQAIRDRGYSGKFDGFAIHAYGNPETRDIEQNLRDFQSTPLRGYSHQLEILDALGFQSSPVYLTEWNRMTPGPSPEEEAVTAQFLHRALAELNEWNQSHHPIVCACWFVYHDWGGWGTYSIRSLKSPGTADEDVWQAFQQAAQQGYPAGYPEAAGGSMMVR